MKKFFVFKKTMLFALLCSLVVAGSMSAEHFASNSSMPVKKVKSRIREQKLEAKITVYRAFVAFLVATQIVTGTALWYVWKKHKPLAALGKSDPWIYNDEERCKASHLLKKWGEERVRYAVRQAHLDSLKELFLKKGNIPNMILEDGPILDVAISTAHGRYGPQKNIESEIAVINWLVDRGAEFSGVKTPLMYTEYSKVYPLLPESLQKKLPDPANVKFSRQVGARYWET